MVHTWCELVGTWHSGCTRVTFLLTDISMHNVLFLALARGFLSLTTTPYSPGSVSREHRVAVCLGCSPSLKLPEFNLDFDVHVMLSQLSFFICCQLNFSICCSRDSKSIPTMVLPQHALTIAIYTMRCVLSGMLCVSP